MKEKPKTCFGCQWGEFWLTPSGRPKKDNCGRCMFKPDQILDEANKKLPISYRKMNISQFAIWPKDDATDCPQFKPKDA